MADTKQEIKSISINRRIKKSNSELLGKVQVYVVNKKNKPIQHLDIPFNRRSIRYVLYRFISLV